jgi:hypothetical protein
MSTIWISASKEEEEREEDTRREVGGTRQEEGSRRSTCRLSGVEIKTSLMGNENIQRFTGPPPRPPPLFVSMIPRGDTTSGRLGLRQGEINFLAVDSGARAPRGGVTRPGVVLTDLQSLRDCQ